ncbi:MAG: rRNA maturation RNase YbeY [Candidatus Kerfeldbacteria bacterium]|nr:rRNA maturation RNase YbeY [Candidatus Kerfeldbacteria bacterium]
MQVTITRAPGIVVQTSFIHKLSQVIGRVLPRYRGSAFSIAFVSNSVIRRLNKTYRRKDAPTDVLSFAERESASGWLDQNYLGDIVIAYPYARRQARLQGISIRQELVWLVTHGFLHLIGHDHMRPQEQRRMLALEKKIINRFTR